MPIKRALTPNELNALEKDGYDTSSYKGEPVEFPDPEQTTSAREALGKHLLANILPSLASAGGFAAGMQGGAAIGALGGPAAPVTIPIGAVLGGLIGGGVAGGATRKLQDVITPQSVLDNLEIAQKEHPIASTIGNVGAGMLVMRPDIGTVRNALGAIPQVLARGGAAGKTLATREGIDALKTIGAGAGISAAGSIGEQTIHGNIDPEQVIKDTLLGAATMHKPTSLGHMVMRSSEPVRRVLSDPDAMTATLGELPNLNEHVKQYADYIKQQKNINKALKLSVDEQKIKNEQEALKKAITEPIKDVKIPSQSASKSSPKPSTETIKKPEAGNEVIAATKPTEIAPPVQPPTASQTETLPMVQPVVQPVPPVVEIDRKPLTQLPIILDKSPIIQKKVSKEEFYSNKRKEHEKSIAAIADAWQESADTGSNRPLEEVVKSYGGTGEDINHIGNLQPHSDEFVQAVMRLRGDKSRPSGRTSNGGKIKTTPIIESKNVPENALEPITPEEEYDGKQLNQKNENIQTPLGKEVSQAISDKGKATAPTSAYKAAIEELNTSRGLNTKESPTITTKGQITGKDVLVNPKLETIDTRPHEAAHDLVSTINEAAEKGSSKAKKYVDDLKKAQQEGLDTYNKDRVKQGLMPIDHEEFTASEQGHEFLKQQLNLNKEGKWRKWWNDTKALWNTAYGKNPSIEDLRRTLNFRYVNEKVNGVERTTPNVAKKEEENKPLSKQEVKPYKDASEKDVAIKGIKDEAGAREVLGILDKEKDMLAKQGIDKVGDEKERHSIANKMMANKLDSQIIAEKYGIKDYKTKYQDEKEGLNRNEQDEPWSQKLKRLTQGSYIRPLTSEEFIRYDEFRKILKAKPEIYNRKTKTYDVNPEARHLTESEWSEYNDLDSKAVWANMYDKADNEGPKSRYTEEIFNSLKLPKIEHLDEVKRLGYTYDGPQDWGAPVGIMHAFTNKGENPNDLARRATFYAKQGEEGKIVELAKAKNAEFNKNIPVESMEDFKKRVTPKMQGENEGLPHTSLDSDILASDPSKQSFIRSMSATFDKVKSVSKPIAQAATNYEARKSQYTAQGTTALVDLQKYNREDVNKVMAAHRDAYRNDTEPTLESEKDKTISKILSDYYGKIADLRNEMGLTIDNRKAGKNKYYIPDMMSAETADVFTNHPLSPEAMHLKKEWEDHILEQAPTMDAQEVRSDINEYIGALGGKSNNYKSLEFGAIRKAAGFGLPESMRDKDAILSLARYSRRAASDLAFFKEIQSRPEIAGPLHIKDINGHVPDMYKDSPLFQVKEIKDMMKWVTNDLTHSSQSPKLRSLTRLINNSLLGPATGIRDLVSVPMNAIPYIHQFSDLGAAIKGIALTKENSRMALETGARQPQIDRVAMGDIMDSPNRFATVVGKAADFMRKAQGREEIENFSRDVTFSIGKELARNNIIGAKNGKEGSIKWLEKFSDLVEGDVTKLQGDKLEAAINQIGKNFTDRNQGTYGGRGLPVGIMESQFAPFFALQKWSVEKANVIYKDVYKPFISGENRLPMLTYTLGSFMTGAAIQKLNELMSNKKGSDPTIVEALDKGDAASIAQEIATIMQLGSYAGLVSDTLKAAADMGIRGKVPRNIVSFPTATAAVKTGESVADFLEAIRQGEDPFKALKAFSLDLAVNNVQAARLIANHTVNDEDADRKDKFRDIRVFDELENKPAANITKVNPYLNLDSKEFKRSKDLGEAAGMIPDMVSKAVDNAEGSGETLRKSLSSMKGNSFQVMPSPKDSVESFTKYYQFLVRTQGQEMANERVKDYFQQNALNKVKSHLIP